MLATKYGFIVKNEYFLCMYLAALMKPKPSLCFAANFLDGFLATAESEN